MRYKCVFPSCSYCTNSRSKIDFHHVVPRELDPSPRNKLTVPLCKTHHALIYCPDVKYGQHSIKDLKSLIILNIFKSTDGDVIHYKDMYETEFYYFIDSEEITKIE
jgi:hypothetical protein